MISSSVILVAMKMLSPTRHTLSHWLVRREEFEEAAVLWLFVKDATPLMIDTACVEVVLNCGW